MSVMPKRRLFDFGRSATDTLGRKMFLVSAVTFALLIIATIAAVAMAIRSSVAEG